MQPFTSLSRRGQLGRLRRLGRTALASYGLEDTPLTLLRHEHNTTFRVDAVGGQYVLRINRPGAHMPAIIESETAWLAALRRDTELAVPEPVAARDGSLVVVTDDPGVPEERASVLLRWLDGRFADRRLAPIHMRRVGVLEARLQEHAASWKPPASFVRPRVDTLTTEGKIASLASSAASARAAEHPTNEDGEQGRQLVESLVSREDAALFDAALERVRATTRALAAYPAGFGLIHGDLHYENILFHRGEARAIDFDDCGWGFHLYDLAVTLWELEERPTYEKLRHALLEAYAEYRAMPDDHALHLGALFILRRMQMLMWVLESREHPAFRDEWWGWAREELDVIAQTVLTLG